jgi:hypothetical protein
MDADKKKHSHKKAQKAQKEISCLFLFVLLVTFCG